MPEKKPSPLASPGPWNLVSSGYEKFTRGFLSKYSQAGLPRLGLKPEHALLDVACGPGTTSLLAAPSVAELFALDFAEEMVELCRQNLGAAGHTNAQVQVGDGQDLPYSEESFDRAVSMFGLMFFPDRVRGMKEIHRCLRPGGRVLLSSWAPVEKSPLMQVMFETGKHAAPDSYVPPKFDPESLENPDVFARELTSAGFSEISIEPVQCAYDYSSGGILWDEMVEGAVPLVMAQASMKKEEWDAYSDKCRAFLEESLKARPVLYSTAWLAVARKGD